MQTFFGLPELKGNRDLTKEESALITKKKQNLYREIWNLSYRSEGAVDWNTIYALPTWVRRLNIKFLNEDIKKANDEMKQKKGKARMPSAARSVSRRK